MKTAILALGTPRSIKMLKLLDKTLQNLFETDLLEKKENNKEHFGSIQSLVFESLFERSPQKLIFGMGFHDLADNLSDSTVRILEQEYSGQWKLNDSKFSFHKNFANAVAVDLKTHRVISGGDERGDGNNLILLLDPKTENAAFAFVGHKGIVNGIALSQDGRHLVSAGSDGTVRLWSMESIPINVSDLFQQQSDNQLELWDFSGRKLQLIQKDNVIQASNQKTDKIEVLSAPEYTIAVFI